MSVGWLNRLRLMLQAFMRRDRFEADLAEELAFHRQARTDELVAAGLAPAAAARQARLELGMTELHRDDCRRARGLDWMDAVACDLRYVLRSLRRSPGYTLTTVGVLAVPVAACLLLFALLNAYGLRNPPIERADRWVAVDGHGLQRPSIQRWTAEEADALLAEPPAAFVGLTAERPTRLSLDVDGPRTGVGEAVSTNFFSLLGVPAAQGRVFDPANRERDRGGIVLSERGRERLFDGAADVVGRRLLIAGQPFEVIGVADRGFVGTQPWAALYWMLESDYRRLQPSYAERGLALVLSGFLQPGVDPQQAADALGAQALRVSADREPEFRLAAAQVTSRRGYLHPTEREDALLAGIPIAIALLALLAIAAANLANLVLARFVARRHELALRGALGAPRARMLVPLVAECGMLAVLAALLAFGLVALLLGPAHGHVFGLLAEFGIDLIEVAVDGRVLVGGLLLSLAAAALFGALPAWLVTAPFSTTSRQPDAADLKRANPGRLGGALMVGQLATSVVLVVIAGLIAANARRIEHTPLGFEPGRLAVLDANAGDGRAPVEDRLRLARRLQALPEVEAIAATAQTPLMGDPPRVAAVVDGRSQPLMLRWVDAGYFAALQLEVQRGRGFSVTDESLRSVAVVSRRTADWLWPGQDPLGRTIDFAPEAGDDDLPRRVEVIGVVEDIASGWLLGGLDRSAVYLPVPLAGPSSASLLIALRDARPETLRTVYRACMQVAAEQGCQPFLLSSALRLQQVPLVIASRLAAALGWTALAISCIGLYGLVGFLVQQRRREIGVRMALGATAPQVTRLSLRRAGRQILLGLAIGLPLAFALSRLVAATTERVDTWDARAFVLEPLLLVAVALLAAWLPARRSAAVDPCEALRRE